ncbi:MAG: hypothetical protein H6747_13935 [Deltaproteobacteria bacterium]|nr:hypothetical protein [Deltaproteobacteria bacterium]
MIARHSTVALLALLLAAPAAFAAPQHRGHANGNPKRGYNQQGYAKPGHAKQGYAKHGYAKPSYAKPSYAKHGHATQHVKVQRHAPAVVVRQAVPARRVVTQSHHHHGTTYSPGYRAAAWGYAPAPVVVAAPQYVATAPWCDAEVRNVARQMRMRYGTAARLAVLRHAMATHHGWIDGGDLLRLAGAVGPSFAVRDVVALVRSNLRPLPLHQRNALLHRTHPTHRGEVLAMVGGPAYGPAHGPTVAMGW